MNLFKFIGQIFKPAADLIDAVHTSEEERLKVKAIMLEQQVKFMEYALDYETKQLEAKAEIILAETKSESWITRSWRPITMLTFLALVVLDQTGMLAFRLAPEAWTLLQIGIGGYAVGRSAEKLVPAVLDHFNRKDE